jgi:hypothetical protein
MSLFILAGGIIGISFLLLEATVWKTPREKEPLYNSLPGIQMDGLAPAEGESILKRLNAQRCPCDCARTVASCRNHHASCSFSLAIAREAVASIRKNPRQARAGASNSTAEAIGPN